MKIVYVHQHFSTPAGKVGIRSYQMAQALVQQGHSVTMVCGSFAGAVTGLSGPFVGGKRQGEVDHMHVIEFDMNYSNHDGFFKRSATFARFAIRSSLIALTSSYDLIFTTTTPLTVGLPGILARWVRRKPFVFEVRDLWPELPRKMGVITNPLVLTAMEALEWASYRSANRCVALSPGIAKGIESKGVAPARIAMVPNGCDLDIFDDLHIEPWAPETVAASDFMALFSGTHGIANGLKALISVAEILQTRGRHDIKLVLAGDGKEKKDIVELAEAKGLRNIIFLPPMPKQKLAGLMARADVGLQILANVPAFYYGTSPNKFFDYIAASRPVLVNYPGWLADLIVENACGFCVPPENPGAFADALEAAARDRPELAAKGQRALHLAKTQFSRKELAKAWTAWVTQPG